MGIGAQDRILSNRLRLRIWGLPIVLLGLAVFVGVAEGVFLGGGLDATLSSASVRLGGTAIACALAVWVLASVDVRRISTSFVTTASGRAMLGGLVLIALVWAWTIGALTPVSNLNVAVWSLGLIAVIGILFPAAFSINIELGVGGLVLVLMLANNLRDWIYRFSSQPSLPEIAAVTILVLLHLAKAARGRVDLAHLDVVWAPVIVFGVSLCVSGLVNGGPQAFSSATLAWLGILAFWVMTSELVSKRQVQNLALVLVLLVAFGALFSFYRILRELPLSVLADPKSLYQIDLVYTRSLFAGPMDFGNALITTLPLALMTAQLESGWRRRIVQGSIVASVALIVLSFQRGAWLVAAAIFVLWALINVRKAPRWLLLLLLLIPLLLSVQGIFYTRVQSLGGTLQETGVVGRFQGWQAGLAMMRDHPWLGVGLGQYQVYFLQYRPAGGLYEQFVHAHNVFITLGAEAGLICLAAWLIAIALYFKYLWPRLFSGSSESRTLALGLTLAMAGYLAHGSTSAIRFVDTQHYNLVNTMIFWVLLAIAISWRRPAPAD